MSRCTLSESLKSHILYEISKAYKEKAASIVLPSLLHKHPNPIMVADAVSTFLVQQGLIKRGALSFQINFENYDLQLNFPVELPNDPVDDLV
jgi:hypothetical protein